MSRAFFGGAVVAAIALIVGATARAQNDAPVQIDSCAPIINSNSNSFPQASPTPSIAGLFPLAATSSGMAITFVNTSTKTADLVNFAVDSNGVRFIIRDVGTFSPDVQIVHQYRNGSGQAFVLPQFIAPQVRCHVASVRFTDGSVWRPGQASQPPPPPAYPPAGASGLSASPRALTIDTIAESELFLVSSSRRVTAFREADSCGGIANVFVAATGESSATYSVKPIAPGTCTAIITDEDGNTLNYPITVR
jgi:hypothetical protein